LKAPQLKRIILIALLTALLLVWFEGTRPIQDDFQMENIFANGTSELRTLNAQPMNQSLRELANNSTKIKSSTIILLAPKIPYSNEESRAIQRILSIGGIVLISDNFGAGNTLLTELGVPIRFGNATIADDLFFEGAPDFPVIYDLPAQMVAQGVNELALNRAVPLQIRSFRSVRVLASTSPFSFLDLNSNGKRDPKEPRGPFPVLAQLAVGRGLLYVFSSPGSLSNGMLQIQDNAKFLSAVAGGRAVLVDQSHLGTSLSTELQLSLRGFFDAVAAGSLDRPTKVSIASIAVIGMLIWSVSPKIQEELARRRVASRLEPKPRTIEEILAAHPTWNRARLEYLEKEALMVKKRWRPAIGERA
jgi:hypothetical protein